MRKIYFVTAAVFFMVIFALRVFNLPETAKFCIPAFVLMVALYSFINAKDRSFKQGSLLLTLGLVFAFFADSVINFISAQIGVLIFFAAHICLLWYYFKKKPPEKKEIVYIIPFAAVSAMFYTAVLPNLTSELFIYGLPFYLALLTLMLWRAVCLFRDKDNLKIILGSVLFYLTDISVIMMFVYDASGTVNIKTALNIETWAMYPPALFLLSLIDNKE